MAYESVENNDEAVGFTITAKGTPVPLASLVDIYIWVYVMNSGNKVLLETYKKTGTGLTQVHLDGVVTNRCYIVVGRNVTRKSSGILYAEIKLVITANTDYEDELKNDGKTGILLFPISPSISPNVPD